MVVREAGPKVVISEAALHSRIVELGQRISRDYDGRVPLVVGVLKGSFVFVADLVRSLNIPVEIDFIMASSYGNDARSSGAVRLLSDLSQPIEGRDVLVVEDIVDTGLTLRYLLELLRVRRPATLEVCALMHKASSDEGGLQPKYVGFPCPDEFVVGYGLDHGGLYRNLPYIATLAST